MSAGKLNLPDKSKILHPLALNYRLMFHLEFFEIFPGLANCSPPTFFSDKARLKQKKLDRFLC